MGGNAEQLDLRIGIEDWVAEDESKLKIEKEENKKDIIKMRNIE